MKKARVFLIAALIIAGAGSMPAATLIRDAVILTVTNGTIERGSILIEDGRIVALGANVQAPEDAEIIDATGRYVTPGIVDCHSHIAADSINEGSIPVSSMVSVQDVLDPQDIRIYRALAGGVTTANILHGSANPIGGQTVVLKMRWGKTANEMVFEGAMPGIKFALGENPKRSNSRNRSELHPNTRQGVNDVIRQAFLDAKAYQALKQAYEQAQAAGRVAIPPRRDLRLDPLVEILEGERLVHVHSYRADEILAMIRLADEIGFKIATLQHVLEGYKVAKEIAAHGAGASTFSDWWAYKIEAGDAIPHNAAIMVRKGVLVSINSDSGEEMRHLPHEAAKTMKWGGLNETEALALVTINPAKQLRIENRVGSIEVGKDADLVIWDGPPLSVYSKVLTTFVDGEIYFDRTVDLESREQRSNEKQELLTKLEAEKEEASEEESERPSDEPEDAPR